MDKFWKLGALEEVAHRAKSEADETARLRDEARARVDAFKSTMTTVGPFSDELARRMSSDFAELLPLVNAAEVIQAVNPRQLELEALQRAADAADAAADRASAALLTSHARVAASREQLVQRGHSAKTLQGVWRTVLFRMRWAKLIAREKQHVAENRRLEARMMRAWRDVVHVEKGRRAYAREQGAVYLMVAAFVNKVRDKRDRRIGAIKMLQGGIKMHLFRNDLKVRRARRQKNAVNMLVRAWRRKRERIFNLRQLNKEKWPRGWAARLHRVAPPGPSRHVKHGDPKENVSVWRRATRDARIEEAALRGFARRGGHAGSEYEAWAGAALSDASLRAINDDRARHVALPSVVASMRENWTWESGQLCALFKLAEEEPREHAPAPGQSGKVWVTENPDGSLRALDAAELRAAPPWPQIAPALKTGAALAFERFDDELDPFPKVVGYGDRVACAFRCVTLPERLVLCSGALLMNAADFSECEASHYGGGRGRRNAEVDAERLDTIAAAAREEEDRLAETTHTSEATVAATAQRAIWLGDGACPGVPHERRAATAMRLVDLLVLEHLRLGADMHMNALEAFAMSESACEVALRFRGFAPRHEAPEEDAPRDDDAAAAESACSPSSSEGFSDLPEGDVLGRLAKLLAPPAEITINPEDFPLPDAVESTPRAYRLSAGAARAEYARFASEPSEPAAKIARLLGAPPLSRSHRPDTDEIREAEHAGRWESSKPHRHLRFAMLQDVLNSSQARMKPHPPTHNKSGEPKVSKGGHERESQSQHVKLDPSHWLDHDGEATELTFKTHIYKPVVDYWLSTRTMGATEHTQSAKAGVATRLEEHGMWAL